jgi:hypothetical protein
MPGVKANTQKKGTEKEKPGGGGQEGMKARLGGAPKMKCAICMTEVNANSKSQLSQHHDAKHSKLEFEKCWPDWKDE